MVDIVERLRDTTGIHEELIYEAADEIERLRKQNQTQALDFIASEGEWCEMTDKKNKEIERLREALRTICDGARDVEKSYAELFAEVKIEARAALKGNE